MNILSLRSIRRFLDKNGFESISVEYLAPINHDDGYIHFNESDFVDNEIHKIEFIELDNDNYVHRFSYTHTMKCILNDFTVVKLRTNYSALNTIRFIHFIQRTYGFSGDNIAVTYRDVKIAYEDNDLEWFEMLFKSSGDGTLRFIHKCIYNNEWDFMINNDIEIKNLLIREMSKRNINNEGDILL